MNAEGSRDLGLHQFTIECPCLERIGVFEGYPDIIFCPHCGEMIYVGDDRMKILYQNWESCSDEDAEDIIRFMSDHDS